MKGTCLKGRYLLGEVIGKGGMAVVYKAYDFRTGRTVAVKVLRDQYSQDAEFVRRFQQEAEAASAITHENLIDIYDVGEQNGTRFIVMEYVDGMTLKSLIKEHGALDNYSAITIARQICTALQVAHDAHIIHRDIKPQNILLDRKGIAVLADFGIAKTSDTQTITGDGESGVLGSVHYFSPEQARGEGANACSDLYSLGVVLYEMVTAELPFQGDTAVAIALHHMNTEPTPPIERNPRVTPALNEIILKAIRKKPEDRYQSAREFYDDLSLALVYPEGGFIRDAKKKDAEGKDGTEQPKKENDRSGKKKAKLFNVKKHIRSLKWALMGLCTAMILLLCATAFVLTGGTRRLSVPEVVNTNLDAATARLENMGLSLEVAEKVYDDNTLPGTIVEQKPQQGTQVKNGETVSVVVCLGPESAAVPDLDGMTQEEAANALAPLGLHVGVVTHRQDSDAPRGTVIEQYPDQGEVLENGGTVDLTLSDQPLMRDVPNVLGKTLEETRQRLKEYDLQLGDVHYEYATGYDVGEVFRQSPESGTQLRQGDSVNVWVVENIEMATCEYQLTVNVKKDDSQVSIFVEEGSLYKEIFNWNCDRGTLDIQVTLENETAGDKTLIIMVNDEEVKRETVTFVGGQ